MKFERLRQAFWDASHVITTHQSHLIQFQNTFTTDFPLTTSFYNEAETKLAEARVFVWTAESYYEPSSKEYKTLRGLFKLISEAAVEFHKLSKENSK